MAAKKVTLDLTMDQARIIYLLATRDGSFDWFGKNVEEIVIFEADPDGDCPDLWELFEESVDALKDQLLTQGVDLEGPA